jgi:hypothetical protein
MEQHAHDGQSCIWCGLDYDFDLPDGLVDICHRGDLVIFAGAGISTEVPAVFPVSLYSEVQNEIGGGDGVSFPELMERYEAKQSRSALVQKIKKKFDYVDSFPNSRRASRSFHRELATIPFVSDIVTTNWDTYFEEECFASPFVSGEDVAFRGLYERRVYKLHGTITNLSTIVATESDYDDLLGKLSSNVLGAHVRQLLSTKTVVFIGYSLSDWNFQRLFTALRQDMGRFAPKAYFVSPFPSENAKKFGLSELKTSGVNFLRKLKSEIASSCFIDDTKYDEVAQLQDLAYEADEIAKGVSHKDYPSIIFCWSYHDGLTDACFRILQRRMSGEYSNRHRVQFLARTYSEAADKAYDAGRYTDSAYLEGYANALILLLGTDQDEVLAQMPLYFMFGADSSMRTEPEFSASVLQSRRRAPRERKFARAAVKDLGENMVLEHSRILVDLAG